MKIAFSLALALVGVQASSRSSRSYSSYKPKYSKSHNKSYSKPNPDADETWYSSYLQFRPTKIFFKPVYTKSTTYALCEFDFNGNQLQFAQTSGQATIVKVNLAEVADENATVLGDTEFGFRFNELAKAFTQVGGDNCPDVGDVWNPLTEKDSLGRDLKYQDPSRGNVDSVTTDVDGNVTDVVQKKLEQNLTGEYSIIGRSVTMWQLTDGEIPDDATPFACCVIGFDRTPETASEPTHHHHGNQGSYGGYSKGYGNGYGSGYGSSYGKGYGKKYSSKSY